MVNTIFHSIIKIIYYNILPSWRSSFGKGLEDLPFLGYMGPYLVRVSDNFLVKVSRIKVPWLVLILQGNLFTKAENEELRSKILELKQTIAKLEKKNSSLTAEQDRIANALIEGELVRLRSRWKNRSRIHEKEMELLASTKRMRELERLGVTNLI